MWSHARSCQFNLFYCCNKEEKTHNWKYILQERCQACRAWQALGLTIIWLFLFLQSPLTFVWPGVPKDCWTDGTDRGAIWQWLEHHLTIFCTNEIVASYVVVQLNLGHTVSLYRYWFFFPFRTLCTIMLPLIKAELLQPCAFGFVIRTRNLRRLRLCVEFSK